MIPIILSPEEVKKALLAHLSQNGVSVVEESIHIDLEENVTLTVGGVPEDVPKKAVPRKRAPRKKVAPKVESEASETDDTSANTGKQDTLFEKASTPKDTDSNEVAAGGTEPKVEESKEPVVAGEGTTKDLFK